MKKKSIKTKKIMIADKHKKLLLCSIISVVVIVSIIVLSYSNLGNLKNNSVVATDLSFNDHPAIVNHLNEVAKTKIGVQSGREFNLFYDNTYNGVDWCAMFIWWLFNQDGRAKNMVVKDATADGMVRESVKAGLGTWHEDYCEDPSSQPRAGDLIVFDPEYGNTGMYIPGRIRGSYSPIDGFRTRDKYLSSHIGYIFRVDNNNIYTIEGNRGGKVSHGTYSKNFCSKTASSRQTINGYYRPNYAPHYTVKFMPNGGSGSMSIQYFKKGQATKLLPNKFTRSGYTFNGWIAQKDTGEKYCYAGPGNVASWLKSGCYGYYYFYNQQELTNTYGNDGVVYMYAQWKKNTPTAESTPQKAASGEGVKRKVVEIKATVIERFTVKYYPGGGTGKMNDQTINYGYASGSNLYGNTFKRSDHKFIGWNAQREDGKWYCFTNSSKTKASWLPISSCRYGYYLYKDKQSVPTIVKGGSYVKMVAQWQATTFTVKFRGNGGSGSMSDQKMTYGAYNTLKSNVFTKSGYVFNGWVAQRWDGKAYCYTNPAKTSVGWVAQSNCDAYYHFKNKQQLTTTVPAGKTVTMFAQWKWNKFTVAYYSGGGTGKMNNQYITYGSSTNLYGNAFKKRGYTFIGWNAQREDGKWYCYTDPSKSRAAWLKNSQCFGYYLYKDKQAVSTTVQPGSYVKMVAQWKTRKFLVRFNANGGTGKMNDQQVIYGEPTKLYGNAFKRKGYKFVGWVAQKDTGEIYCYIGPDRTSRWHKKSQCYGYYYYSDKQSVSKTVLPNRMVTMFAQWKKI